METIPIHGHVVNQHRLSAVVPGSIPAGPVTVWIAAGMKLRPILTEAGFPDVNAP
jgi:hypothetical protein